VGEDNFGELATIHTIICSICTKCSSTLFVATLALGSRPNQGFAKVWAKSELGSHISCSRECKKVWGNEAPTLPNELPLWELESQWTPESSEGNSRGQKSLMEIFFISLESYQWGLQLCFRPHFNRRSAHNVMGLQSCENPNFGNFETPTLESWDKMTFGCWSHG
jgi:hypothetical protein